VKDLVLAGRSYDGIVPTLLVDRFDDEVGITIIDVAVQGQG